MNTIPQITLYARQTGLAITTWERRADGCPTEGRIALRFFQLTSGGSVFRFIAEPAEAFALHGKIRKVLSDGGRETLVHTFKGPDGEVQTRLVVERWERNGKSGCAFAVQRGEQQINVPVSEERFLYAAEFLRYLSLQQAWVEEKAPGAD
jgi:hypothetical protein